MAKLYMPSSCQLRRATAAIIITRYNFSR